MKLLGTSLFGATLIACSGTPTEGAMGHRCDVKLSSPMTSAGIGNLRLGMSQSSLTAICPGIKMRVEEDPEGLPTNIASLPSGLASIELMIEDNHVRMIRMADPKFSDTNGNRPGTKLRIQESSGFFGTEEDGRLFVHEKKDCGVSYLTDFIPGDREHLGTWQTEDLLRLRDLMVVDIRLAGCRD